MPRITFVLLFFIFGLFNYMVCDEYDEFLSVEALGRGGANIALSDDLSVFAYNPAGLADKGFKKGWLFWYHKFSIDGHSYKGLRQLLVSDFLFSQNSGADTASSQGFSIDPEIGNMINELKKGDIELRNAGPLLVAGYFHRYFGFLWYTDEYLRINIIPDTRIVIPFLTDKVRIKAGTNSFFALGGAYKYKNMQIGLALKYWEKWYSTAQEGLVAVFEMASNGNFDTLTKQLKTVYRENYATMDLGAKYWFGQYFAVGIAANELWTFYSDGAKYDISTGGKSPYAYTLPRMRISLGLVYYFDLPQFLTIPPIGLVYSRKTLFALDIKDIFHRESIFKKIDFGLEAEVKRFLRLRFGFDQGYPVFGFGLDFLNYYYLDYALHYEERGIYAGWRPHAKHIIRFMIKI